MPEVFGVREFAEASNVSHETLARLEAYVVLLIEWNARQNMVSKASLAEVWQRHVWDSAQLEPLIPKTAKTLVDLGSGAGFPALVLAAMRPELKVTLYEATAKKCRFLVEAANVLHVEVDIRNTRIEEAAREGFDALTARACAPLELLLSYANRFQEAETVNLFLKGQDIEAELREATKSWRMKVQRHPSRSGSGTILEIRKLAHVQSGRPFVQV
ncbi:MAG TPA: 16S rRNA (guanine(527)-N(7))-methyltransferase RsmG [Rhizomicrobium sp.]